jgi:hypothetical protein
MKGGVDGIAARLGEMETYLQYLSRKTCEKLSKELPNDLIVTQ